VARLISKLGQISYGLFLVHFPVLMLGNALFVWWQQTPPVNSHISAELALALCWGVSIVLAVWFERYVEAPLVRRIQVKGR
jgi:peptidoglycan/LPS O-acetylase OafA/YrhL